MMCSTRGPRVLTFFLPLLALSIAPGPFAAAQGLQLPYSQTIANNVTAFSVTNRGAETTSGIAIEGTASGPVVDANIGVKGSAVERGYGIFGQARGTTDAQHWAGYFEMEEGLSSLASGALAASVLRGGGFGVFASMGAETTETGVHVTQAGSGDGVRVRMYETTSTADGIRVHHDGRRGWTGKFLGGKGVFIGPYQESEFDPANDVDPEYLLAVDGKMLAEEVLIKDSENWADYVFDPDYTLTPLRDVETHITAFGHLPGMPTSGEIVAAGGFEVGALQKKLLEKVEELTLYLIEQDKLLADVRRENDKLREAIDGLVEHDMGLK